MKLSKKILAAFSAIATLAMVGTFTGCSDEDDVNEMISGSNNNYSIDYTNEATDLTSVSRGYKTSDLKHAGALVKINFESTSGNGGMMGFIFDYEKNDGKANFSIIGVRQDGAYYVSQLYNITDLGAKNFGATALTGTDLTTAIANGTACEKEIVAWSNTYPEELSNFTTDKSAYLWVIQSEDGSNYKIYNLTEDMATSVEVKDSNNGTLVYTDATQGDVTLPPEIATITTDYTAQTQKKYGVYANVYASSSVKGTWTLLGSYKEANIVED
jgi:hypothetical protein